MKISVFTGEFDFLSNFFPATFVWEGIVWPTSEHAFQAAKSLDKKVRLEFSKLKSPGLAKRRGREIECRSDWNKVRVGIMKDIVRAKFNQNPDIKELLLATGTDELEEGNTWNDKFWGVSPPDSFQGLNNLGRILMELRDEFRT